MTQNGTAIVFTGQGAQKPGMCRDLYHSAGYGKFKDTVDSASEYLKLDLSRICFDSSAEELSETKNAQLSISTLSFAIYSLLSENNITASFMGGFSLGEMTALAASGVLPFHSLLDLIQIRGMVMDSASRKNPGAMYSIIGRDDSLISEICAKTRGLVTAANFNSPVQTVISGEIDAASAAAAELASLGARTVKLNVAGAFHTKLMLADISPLSDYLQNLSFNPPAIPLYSNLSGEKFDQGVTAGHAEFSVFMRDYIIKQMTSPVLFKQEIAAMESDGAEIFIETGVGKVLSGLIKRISANARIFNVEDIPSFEKTIACLNLL